MTTGDLIVAGIVVLLLVMAVGTLLNNRRKGVNSCGCKCSNCRNCSVCMIQEKDIDRKE